MRATFVAPGMLAACWLATPAMAESEADGWYLAAGGSISLLEASHTTVEGKPVPPGYSKHINVMNAGPGVQIAIGHCFGDVRLEVEGGYARNESDHYIAVVPTNARVTYQGGHKAWRAMANAYYDFGHGPVRPYVGIGAGYVDLKARLFSARTPFPTEAPRLILNDHKGELAYQAMAGTSYEVTSRLSVTAQYRCSAPARFISLTSPPLRMSANIAATT